MSSRDKESYSIQAVENALSLLEALGEVQGDVGLSQLTERLGMNKSSLFRLMATFEQRGYVEHSGHSGKYRVGLSAYETGQKLLLRMGLLKTVRPVMERLARDCDEAVYLGVPRDGDLLLLDMVNTAQKVTIVSLAGERFPLAATAAGRLHLPGAEGRDHGTVPPKWQPLARRGELGLDRGGLGEGIACLAVPVCDERGAEVATLALVGPDFRFSSKKLTEELIPRLVEAGETASSRLGYARCDPLRRLG